MIYFSVSSFEVDLQIFVKDREKRSELLLWGVCGSGRILCVIFVSLSVCSPTVGLKFLIFVEYF